LFWPLPSPFNRLPFGIPCKEPPVSGTIQGFET
jgi:hypothetical protein